MKSEATLVRAKGRVELDTVTTVDLEVAGIVLPDDAELDHTLRDGDNLQGSPVLGLLLEKGAVLKRRGKLWERGNNFISQLWLLKFTFATHPNSPL